MKACRQLLLSFDAFLVHLFSWSATQIHHWPLAKKTLHCCFFLLQNEREKKKSAKTATTFLVKEQKSVKNESTWETFVWCVDFHAWLEKVWKVTKFRTIYGVFETFYFKAMCSCHSKMYLGKKIQILRTPENKNDFLFLSASSGEPWGSFYLTNMSSIIQNIICCCSDNPFFINSSVSNIAFHISCHTFDVKLH